MYTHPVQPYMPRPLPTSCPTHLSEGELNGFILLPLQVVHEVHNGVVCSIHLLLASHQLLSLFSEVDILVQCLLVDVAEPTQLLIAAVQLFPQLTGQELEEDTSLTERHRTTATLHTTPTYPTLHATPTYPTLHATPTYPTLHATPTYPTLHATPTYPTLLATPTYSTLHATPTYSTLHATPTYPTLHATPTSLTPVFWYLAKVSEGREPSSLIFFMHCSCFLRRRLRLVA